MRKQLLMTTAIALLVLSGIAHAGMNEAKTFLDKEIGDLSTLSRADQEKEMQWFVDAAKPFQGMEIKVTRNYKTTVKSVKPTGEAEVEETTENGQVTVKSDPDREAREVLLA